MEHQLKKLSNDPKYKAWITLHEPLGSDDKIAYSGYIIADYNEKKFKQAIAMKDDPNLKRRLKAKIEFVLPNIKYPI